MGQLVSQCLFFNAANLTKSGALDELRVYTSLDSPDIICICETFAHSDISSAELSLNGNYTVFRRDRTHSTGGGVCILLRISLACKIVGISSSSEVLAVDVFLDDSPLRIICAYSTPSGSSVELRDGVSMLCASLEKLLIVEWPSIIVGDFNLPRIDWKNLQHPGSSNRDQIFLDFCILNGLHQLVDLPTRPASGNLLDLLLTNHPDIVVGVQILPAPIRSDHLAISFLVDLCASHVTAAPLPDFRKGRYDLIAESLSELNWGRSTETQLLDVIQSWGVALSTGRNVHCVYFDFTKAFDRVHHGRLLSKLSALGVRQSIVDWIRAYLSDRQFIVKVKNSFSPPPPVPVAYHKDPYWAHFSGRCMS
ncbi:uncharacterized protein LOC108864835 [Galendromus occidentalis]|uniref:Uncharacterized protein LOC108864835 n=1 Tax=Galendromus occidentalis TaxID=34638 RepID=A0AAJ7L7V5_9ACAR|nr:uncharacterized protein LOC108864835 [Galendromus occidentalis]